MLRVSRADLRAFATRARRAAFAASALALGACSGGGFPSGDLFGNSSQQQQPQGTPPPVPGQVRVGLILPMTAQGNAGAVGQSMRNAADLAVSEFNADVQLLVKDDGGTPQGAQLAAQQALDEGAEIILGPLFAQSVQAVGQVARARNIPVIAFSTDSNVAARGVYLLSLLPESDVDRVVDYSISQNKRSFLAMVPENAYGSVVEAEFRQYVARKGGRVVALEHFSSDRARMQGAVANIAASAAGADALFIPGEGDTVPSVVQALAAAGVNLKRLQLLGTGLWDDSRIFADPMLQGGWYPAPDPNGANNFRAFAARYRARFNAEPVRTATLAYDAVALVAALVKTQGQARFAPEVLTNPSGFAGIDGVFRFKPDGTNQRALAVLRVGPQGGQLVSPAPRSLVGSGT